MGFSIIGFAAALWIVLFPPLSLRDQVRQAGDDIQAFLSNQLPWKIKQVKSFFVRRMLILSILIAAFDYLWWNWAVVKVTPAMEHNIWAQHIYLMVCEVQVVFALWNYVCGRLRYAQPAEVDPALRATAAQAMANADAARTLAGITTQNFRQQRELHNPMDTIPAALTNLAVRAATDNHNVVATQAMAAGANADIRHVSAALANAATANAALNTVVRIASLAPANPDLANRVAQATIWAGHAEADAERAESEEDQRVLVWFGRTAWSLPHYWIAFVALMLSLQGAIVFAVAVQEDSQMLVVLSYVPCIMAWGILKSCSEVLAWLVLRGTKAAEWLTTAVADVAVVWMPDNALFAGVRDKLGKGIDLLDEEALAAAIAKWVNMAAIMWLPFMSVAFWTTSRAWVYGFLAATLFATVFSFALIALGEVKKVDDSTKNMTEWFWKWGKVITVLLFLSGGLTEIDWIMNRLAGITPIVILSGHKWWQYLVPVIPASLVLLVVHMLVKKVQGKWSLVWKVPMGIATAFVLGCFMAPIAIACGHKSFALDKRIPESAEKPIRISTPVSEFRAMDNGQQELVITAYSVAKKYGGVVEFDAATAKALNTPEQVSIRTYPQKEMCGASPCWHHELVVTGLTGRERGHYKVILRGRELVVEESSVRAIGAH